MATKCSVTVRETGKRVKESKKVVNWEFKYSDSDRTTHQVEFRHSIMSGKRRLLFDKNIVFSQLNKVALLKESVQWTKKDGRFDHTWYDGSHLLKLHVVEKKDGFLYGELFPSHVVSKVADSSHVQDPSLTLSTVCFFFFFFFFSSFCNTV